MITSELVAQWRAEAERLREQAAAARGDGDPLHADELDACAVDYDQAALDGELELLFDPDELRARGSSDRS